MKIYIVVPFSNAFFEYKPDGLKVADTEWGAKIIKRIEEEKDPNTTWEIHEREIDSTPRI